MAFRTNLSNDVGGRNADVARARHEEEAFWQSPSVKNKYNMPSGLGTTEMNAHGQDAELTRFILRINALETENGAIQADLVEEQRANRALYSKLEQYESSMQDMMARMDNQRQHAKLQGARNWQDDANDMTHRFNNLWRHSEGLEQKLRESEKIVLDAEAHRRDAEERLRQALNNPQRQIEVRPGEASNALVQEMARRSEEQRRRIVELEQRLREGLLDGDCSPGSLLDPARRSDTQKRRIGQLENEVAELRSSLANSTSEAITAQKQIDDLNAQIKHQADKHRQTIEGIEQEALENCRKNQTSEHIFEELSREAEKLEFQMKVKTRDCTELEDRAAALWSERQAAVARIDELVEKNKGLEDISAKYSISTKTLVTLEAMLKAEREAREHAGLEHRQSMPLEDLDRHFMEATRKHRIAMDATLSELRH